MGGGEVEAWVLGVVLVRVLSPGWCWCCCCRRHCRCCRSLLRFVPAAGVSVALALMPASVATVALEMTLGASTETTPPTPRPFLG